MTVLNLKGGVGETHTSWLLTAVCQEQNRRLLAIGTDSQGNLTRSFRTPGEIHRSIERLFDPLADISTDGLIRRAQFFAKIEQGFRGKDYPGGQDGYDGELPQFLGLVLGNQAFSVIAYCIALKVCGYTPAGGRVPFVKSCCH